MKGMQCRVCGHSNAVTLGEIADCEEFARQKISPPIKGGELWLCKGCGSMFRFPTLSSGEYLELYERASSEVWEVDETQRQDFATIYAYLKNHPGGSILDIGCYAGGFLSGISDKFEKFGIEPSISASNSAASKGINILGKTLTDLESKKAFDVIVSIDVIEHVLNVEAFLVDALTHINDNGLLIISTGNPDNFFWKRVFKAKFWYCSYPEHLVFPSYEYFCEFSKRHSLKRPEQIRFRYLELKFMARLSRLLRYIAFSFFPILYQNLKKLRAVSRHNVTAIYSGEPLSPIGIFTDHHVIVIKK